MFFDYYTDELVLNKNNSSTDLKELDNLIESIQKQLNEIGIVNKDINAFYKRNNKEESILGIQLLDGNIEDINNYVIFDCTPFVYGRNILCNIGMHSSAKASNKTSVLVPNIKDEVNHFFNAVEYSINNKVKNTREFDVMKDYYIEKKKEKLLSRFMKRK